MNHHWIPIILRHPKPSEAISLMLEEGNLDPELAMLADVEQDPSHHPEGRVLAHIRHCMDAFASTRTGDEREDLIVGLAVLLHDVGKVSTTEFLDGKWRAYGHEEAGEAPARAFLSRVVADDEPLINDVIALVVNHMRPTFLYKEATRGEVVKALNRSVRRLAREVRLDRLARVVWCDKAGRPPKPQVAPEAEWLKTRSAELGVIKEAPKPILMGRHLIEMGLAPGIQFKAILEKALEQQLNGEIATLEEALAYATVASRPSVLPAVIFPR